MKWYRWKLWRLAWGYNRAKTSEGAAVWVPLFGTRLMWRTVMGNRDASQAALAAKITHLHELCEALEKRVCAAHGYWCRCDCCEKHRGGKLGSGVLMHKETAK